MKMNKIKYGILLGLTISLSIFAFVFYAKSFNHSDYGEWGKEFEFDKDYLMLFVAFVALAIGSGISFYKSYKNEEVGKELPWANFTASCIMFAYPLGVFFKKLSNLKSNFKFDDYRMYFIFGLIGLLLTVMSVFKLIALYKKEENK